MRAAQRSASARHRVDDRQENGALTISSSWLPTRSRSLARPPESTHGSILSERRSSCTLARRLRCVCCDPSRCASPAARDRDLELGHFSRATVGHSWRAVKA